MDHFYMKAQALEEQKFAQREADWRNGAIIYQVFVDRFAEAANLDEKRQLYAHPRRLRRWSETPAAGPFLAQEQVYSHELDFWGGDLQSVASRLDYLVDLGIDVLYLNPIFAAFTNHKYDATDYRKISPEYGTETDLVNLIERVHRAEMKIVLDGVFNHIGRQSELFQNACADPTGPYGDWFYLDEGFSQGCRVWANAHNLPELNLENPAVRAYIFKAQDSIVRSYLRLGIDGWRLDVAFEFGYPLLSELTQAAHLEKPGSLVVGEIWSYPQDWFPALDGVMNFTLRQIMLDCLLGNTAAAAANEMIARMIADAGVEAMLKSWIVLDNHDTRRITDMLPERGDQRLAQVLQFTLPGAPNLYYGSELGMLGGDDPRNRAPMCWDLVNRDNEVYRWMKTLIDLRKKQRALRIGDYHKLLSSRLIAFERRTERVGETLLVIVNPGAEALEESILVPDSKLMNATKFVDLLGNGQVFAMASGILPVRLPPKSAVVLQPQTHPVDGYTPYKRFT